MRSAEHYRSQAEEVRVQMEELRSPVAREVMEDIARQYERLAQYAEGTQAADQTAPVVDNP
jgi:hypothetical protein